jgi:hypothetical protein
MSSREKRVELIKKIEEARNSRVVTYVTGDRVNAPQAIIADDALLPLFRQLSSIGHTDRLDLFIYTRGGVMMSSFRIAKLLREFGTHLGVIVPYRAHSGGTQICAGANEIIMTKMAELGSVDPATANEFNPFDQITKRRINISVEDVSNFLKLAEETAGLVSEDSKLAVFNKLAEQTHPLALGNVNRVSGVVRILVRELLTLHMDSVRDASKIVRITKKLTQFYTHDYLITRDEAKRIGLNVVNPDDALENLIMTLYQEYADDLKLHRPFDAFEALGDQQFKEINHKLAFIESASDSWVYVIPASVSIPQVQPQMVQLPGMPQPTTLIPDRRVLPSIVSFKQGRWVKIADAPDCV